MSHTDVLFRDLHADDLPDVTEIESLCFNCHEDGVTKLLLTKIPFFREVVVASFSCEHCGFHNTSIDSAGKYQDKGVKFTLKVCNTNDMNRRVVLNKSCELSIPELDASFPISNGALTTIEGALDFIIENILELQDERRAVSPELADQLDEFVQKLRVLMEVKTAFTVVVTDAAGNSVIENYMAPKSDPQLIVEHFKRTEEDNERLGITGEEEDSHSKTYADEAQAEFKPADEVMFIQSNCPNCNAPIECRMKVLDIPHFKEVIVMASTCEACGNRENQVTGGCGIADRGQRITLSIRDPIDLARDFLKSDTAGLAIPELELETQPGSLGGRFTTVEGILMAVADQLAAVNPFLLGDSATGTDAEARLAVLVTRVRAVASGDSLDVTLVVTDPAGNSYIQDLYVPEKDPRLTVESYERTDEENEDLGLNDMNTEHYETCDK